MGDYDCDADYHYMEDESAVDYNCFETSYSTYYAIPDNEDNNNINKINNNSIVSSGINSTISDPLLEGALASMEYGLKEHESIATIESELEDLTRILNSPEYFKCIVNNLIRVYNSTYKTSHLKHYVEAYNTIVRQCINLSNKVIDVLFEIDGDMFNIFCGNKENKLFQAPCVLIENTKFYKRLFSKCSDDSGAINARNFFTNYTYNGTKITTILKGFKLNRCIKKCIRPNSIIEYVSLNVKDAYRRFDEVKLLSLEMFISINDTNNGDINSSNNNISSVHNKSPDYDQYVTTPLSFSTSNVLRNTKDMLQIRLSYKELEFDPGNYFTLPQRINI